MIRMKMRVKKTMAKAPMRTQASTKQISRTAIKSQSMLLKPRFPQTVLTALATAIVDGEA